MPSRPRYPSTSAIMRAVDRYADRLLQYTLARTRGHRGRARRGATSIVVAREAIVTKLLLRSKLDREANDAR